MITLKATTIAVRSLRIVQKKLLAWWIYALAVLGGILIDILLVLCLWKIGFFNRRRYKDVSQNSVEEEEEKH